jgi:putative DNA methylase
VLEANGGEPPKVLDMFAGGGAIPLEATRLGCEATALELNPVAHLIELCTLDYPQRYGRSLADDIRRWGGWLIERARGEIGDLYPELVQEGGGQVTLEGATEDHRRIPVAHLWTRTVPCPNPAERPHAAPLVRQTWLVKKQRRCVALRMVPNPQTMTVSYEVVEAPSEAQLGFDPAGFSQRGSTTCPLCGASVDLNYIKGAGKAGRMSVALMAVALLPAGGRGKTYLGSERGSKLQPTPAAVAAALKRLADQGFEPPDEAICDSDTLNFKVPLYGLTTFGELFTERQSIMLLTLCKLAREAHNAMVLEGIDHERAIAIATYLGLLVDRMSDRHSTLCTWDHSKEGISSTFSRQALPMTWDFIEANPFGGSGGDLAMHVETIAQVVEHCSATGKPVHVVRGSALELPLEDKSQDAVITDPPYYDNISYADLSDFFYVWLKRSIGRLHPEHLSTPLTPKRTEAIAASYRHDGDKEAAKAAYEEMMASSFAEARRVLKSDGVLVTVYAHQTTAGWSTLIEAVRRAGFVVVEAWPLDTEMPVRGVAQGTASLASSIFLVARPRTSTETGDWAHEVRPELQRIVAQRVQALADLGITGTDLIISAVGAGMQAYTRFARVEKPNGDELSPDEYLDEVQREVAETVLQRIFRTDRTGLGRVDQETQFYVMGRFEFGEAEVPWDELNVLARGTGVELLERARGAAALVDKKVGKARLRDYQVRGESIEIGVSTIDHLHRILWLANNEPERVKDYLDAARPDTDRLRLVAHALSRPGLDAAGPRTVEATACERVLASWRRLIEDSLFTAGGA